MDNADEVKRFYGEVVGWKPEPVDMGEYQDFNMVSEETGNPVVGVCHKRGPNAGLPSQWMLYITVADLDRSRERCEALGGKILVGPKSMGSHGRYCVIADPAGAVAALIQPA